MSTSAGPRSSIETSQSISKEFADFMNGIDSATMESTPCKLISPISTMQNADNPPIIPPKPAILPVFSFRTTKIVQESPISDQLPPGWTKHMHKSGVPVYYHQPSLVCTFSRPYFIGPTCVLDHDIPISSIPCYEQKMIGQESSGIRRENMNLFQHVFYGPLVADSPTALPSNFGSQKIQPVDLHDYCRELFGFQKPDEPKIKTEFIGDEENRGEVLVVEEAGTKKMKKKVQKSNPDVESTLSSQIDQLKIGSGLVDAPKEKETPKRQRAVKPPKKKKRKKSVDVKQEQDMGDDQVIGEPASIPGLEAPAPEAPIDNQNMAISATNQEAVVQSEEEKANLWKIYFFDYIKKHPKGMAILATLGSYVNRVISGKVSYDIASVTERYLVSVNISRQITNENGVTQLVKVSYGHGTGKSPRAAKLNGAKHVLAQFLPYIKFTAPRHVVPKNWKKTFRFKGLPVPGGHAQIGPVQNVFKTPKVETGQTNSGNDKQNRKRKRYRGRHFQRRSGGPSC